MTARALLAAALLAAVTLTGCTGAMASAGPLSPSIPKYDREAFGNGWADLDHDCQDTRNEVLIRDLADERLDAEGCLVLSGVLHDSYTGRTISFLRGRTTSDDVQIDHLVPLGYAWKAGAWSWTDEQRLAFANDPIELAAVDGPTNGAKSDDGPAAWLPPSSASWCAYAASWRTVLDRYDLQATPADTAKLAQITEGCV